MPSREKLALEVERKKEKMLRGNTKLKEEKRGKTRVKREKHI